MTQQTYGIRYLLNRIIPLKRVGKAIVKNAILTHPEHLPEETLSTYSRIALIKMLAQLFDSNNEPISELKSTLLYVFNKFKVNTTELNTLFDNYVEKRKKAEENFNLLKQKREKMFLKKPPPILQNV
jgi:hypothetical protein